MDKGNRVGTLTFHRNQNYGGILQAYALQQVIKEMGYPTDVIDYLYPGWEGTLYRKKVLNFNAHLWRYNLKVILQQFIYGRALKQRLNRTLDFLHHHIQLSEITYADYLQLEKEFPQDDYKAVICGSDQIWNPQYPQVDDAFFLRFVSTGLRIAYAGSFGVSELPETYISKRKDDFDRFDAISVREDAAIPLVAQMTDKKVYQVLDPSLLLTGEQWSVIAGKAAKVKLPDRYIACYFLNDLRSYLPYLKAISEQYHLPIVSIGYHLFSPQKWLHQVANAGPLEFLHILQNATSVVTDSFHGTAFSMVFKKDFLSFTNRGSIASRLYSLLSLFGLESNLYVDKANISPINYDTVTAILKEKREQSLHFLTQSLHPK